MILGSSRIQYADLPPQSPSHFNFKGQQAEMAAVSMDAKCLGDAYCQARECPYLSCIVVPAQEEKEEDKRLQDDYLVAVEEVCPCERLLYAKAVSVE
jgi:hypothetical protein